MVRSYLLNEVAWISTHAVVSVAFSLLPCERLLGNHTPLRAPGRRQGKMPWASPGTPPFGALQCPARTQPSLKSSSGRLFDEFQVPRLLHLCSSLGSKQSIFLLIFPHPSSLYYKWPRCLPSVQTRTWGPSLPSFSPLPPTFNGASDCRLSFLSVFKCICLSLPH